MLIVSNSRLTEHQFSKLKNRFLALYPDFHSFMNPPALLSENELNYKRNALSRYQKEVGNQQMQEWIHAGRGIHALEEISRRIQTNMVHFLSWRTSIGTTDEDCSAILGKHLDAAQMDYTGPETVEPILQEILDRKLKPSWDTMSTTLWAMNPDQHMPIKISYFRELAEEIGLSLPSGKVDADKYHTVRSFLMSFVANLQVYQPNDMVDVHSFLWCVSPSTYKRTESTIPEEVDESLHVEGATRQIVVNQYERSSKARNQCIRIHGAKCAVCGFDFGERYSDWGEGYIHVHHKVPISDIDEEYEVDPRHDLIPVCPNCHAMIHHHGGTISIEELRSILS